MIERKGLSGELKMVLKILAAFVIFLSLAILGYHALTNKNKTVYSVTAAADGGYVLVGAGDISNCTNSSDKQTAALLEDIPGTIFTLGDNVQAGATLSDYIKCFGSSWGKFKDRIKPAIGNHDYAVPNAAGYFSYFGDSAGPAGKGYYSYDLGTWHVIVLNSNCAEVGCGEGSDQLQWLKNDLLASKAKCTLAYWHVPLFSSGSVHGNDGSVRPFWKALFAAGAEIVLNGHEHEYERFGPQDSYGNARPDGLREFVVGTGGNSHSSMGEMQKNSEVRNFDSFGVLELSLKSGSYEWQFIPAAGKAFTDRGSGLCH